MTQHSCGFWWHLSALPTPAVIFKNILKTHKLDSVNFPYCLSSQRVHVLNSEWQKHSPTQFKSKTWKCMQVVFSKTCKGSQADLVLSSHWLMLMCESTNALTVILKMASVQCWLSDKRSSVNYCTARDWHFKCFSKHQERKKKKKTKKKT